MGICALLIGQESLWLCAFMWGWKWTCCLSRFSCVFLLDLSSFPVVRPFIYSNLEYPTVSGIFLGGLIPPKCCLHPWSAPCSVHQGWWVKTSGLTPAGMLNGAFCWQEADEGMVVLFMRPRTNAGLKPVFVCIFSMCSWQILLMSMRFQRGIRGCCRCGPMARLLKGHKTIQEWNHCSGSPWQMGKVIKVFVYSVSVPFSSKRISRIYGGNPDQDNCMLFVKGKPKVALNLGKTFYHSSQGSVSSVGSPAGESKAQRYFFQFNRESVDVSGAVWCVRMKECACESRCPGEAWDILPRAGDGQHQWKTTGHLFSPLE